MLKRQIHFFNDEQIDFLIHLDKKINISQDTINEIIQTGTKSKVKFLPNRIKVNWGGYSLIQCEINLFKEALRQNHYDFISLISDDTYPIKSKKELLLLLEGNKNKEFLSIYDGYENYISQKFLKYNFFQEKIGVDRKGFFHCLQIFLRYLQPFINRKKIYRIQYKGGSQWCTLTKDCIQYLLKQEKKIKKYFKHTIACDEFFIGTIIYNTKYYENIFKSNKTQSNLFLIEHHNNTRPYTFLINDFNRLIKSGSYFARKINEKTLDAKKLVDKIDSTFIE